MFNDGWKLNSYCQQRQAGWANVRSMSLDVYYLILFANLLTRTPHKMHVINWSSEQSQAKSKVKCGNFSAFHSLHTECGPNMFSAYLRSNPLSLLLLLLLHSYAVICSATGRYFLFFYCLLLFHTLYSVTRWVDYFSIFDHLQQWKFAQ